jgi:hypothetical protein
MAFFNLDNTMIIENSSHEVSRVVGREEDANRILKRISVETPKIIDASETPQQLIKKLDVLYKSALEEGAGFLSGYPASINSKAHYSPHPDLPDMVKVAKREGTFEIGTLAAADFVKEVVRQNREMLPKRYTIASSSDLEKFRGKYTGRILRFRGVEAKMNSYRGGSVFANGLPDVGVCLKASQPEYGAQIYIVEDPQEKISNENHKLEKALDKFGVSYSCF